MAFFLLAAVGCTARQVTCVFHGSEVLRFGRNRFWRALASRFYRAEAIRIAVTTRYVESLLRGSGLLPSGAEILLTPCALPSVFHVEQKEGAEFKSLNSREEAQSKIQGGAAESDLRVLTVARLHPRKGQLEVARALRLLPLEQRARIVYQMVGVGLAAYRQQVETACREGGVRCEFLGDVDEQALGGIYANATVYAQASRTLPQSVEGFGITFLEAAACGCPAAAWRSGGVAEAVLDGETGLLVEEGNLAELAAAVGRLLRNTDLRREIGERGRAFARNFQWEVSTQLLCETKFG